MRPVLNRARRAVAAALLGMLAVVSAGAVTPVYKCVVNGTTTYQRDPCPTGQPREAPTVEQLNGGQKKRRESSGAEGAIRTATPPVSSPAPIERAKVEPSGAPRDGFRCDGRTYCSQMTSCAEAKYFLAHCPGVKMDGDGNGIPCEKQWCGK